MLCALVSAAAVLHHIGGACSDSIDRRVFRGVSLVGFSDRETALPLSMTRRGRTLDWNSQAATRAAGRAAAVGASVQLVRQESQKSASVSVTGSSMPPTIQLDDDDDDVHISSPRSFAQVLLVASSPLLSPPFWLLCGRRPHVRCCCTFLQFTLIECALGLQPRKLRVGLGFTGHLSVGLKVVCVYWTGEKCSVFDDGRHNWLSRTI